MVSQSGSTIGEVKMPKIADPIDPGGEELEGRGDGQHEVAAEVDLDDVVEPVALWAGMLDDVKEAVERVTAPDGSQPLPGPGRGAGPAVDQGAGGGPVRRDRVRPAWRGHIHPPGGLLHRRRVRPR
jgi:hypothetical protein